MKAFLVYGSPYLVASAFAAWVAALVWAWPELRRRLGESLGARGLAGAGALALGALALRLCLRPAHQVFYDEYEHINIAANLARLGALAESMAAGPGLDVLAPSPWPGGWHFVLAGAFKILGAGAAQAFAVNALLGALGVLALTLMTALLLGGSSAGLWAGALAALLPLHLRHSGSADPLVGSWLWAACCLGAAGLLARRWDRRVWAFGLCSFVVAVHWRIENAALALPAAWLLRDALRGRRKSPEALAAAALLLPIPALVWLNAELRMPGFFGGALALSENLSRNSFGIAAFYLRPAAHSLGLLLLALWALLEERAGERRAARLLAGAAAAYLVFYSAYHLGDFSKEGSARYSLSVALPLAALAGWRLSRLPSGFWPRAAAAAMALWTVCPWPAPQAPPERFVAAHAFMRGASASLPADAWVVAFSPPAALSALGRSSVSPYLLGEDPRSWLPRLRSRGFLLRDYWWDKRPEDARRLEALLGREYALEPFSRGECGAASCELLALRPLASAGKSH